MIEKAVILSTGDELTTGRVVDTNSTYIAERLYALGLEVVAVIKVGDSRERLLWALQRAVELGELIIGTGGLGPTVDDLTTEVVGEFFGRKLIMDEKTAEGLKRRFESRTRSSGSSTVRGIATANSREKAASKKNLRDR